VRLLISALLAILFYCPAANSQASSVDTKTLQAILEEVRQLRQEINTTAATVQRAQILIYRLRIQMDVVSRATEKLEQTRNQLAQTKIQRNDASEQIRRFEEVLERTQDANTREQIKGAIEQTKNWLAKSTETEPEQQAKEVQYSTQLQLEREKLEDLQAQLDRLDKKLEVAATKAGGA
jgi:lysyl-tRNA synthetase class I